MATITGTSGNDSLTGTSNNDTLNGLAGNDTLNGGAGGGDVYDGGTGFDTLDLRNYPAVNLDFRFGTIGSTRSGTFANIERVLAGDGNDRLTGAAGDQNLSGRAGNDTLAGGSGADTLWGGAGADEFVFRETGSADADIIGDFSSGSDSIVLDSAVMSALGAAGSFSAADGRFWAAEGASSGHDADDRIVYNTTTRQLFYDADGSGAGAAQLIATLQSGATLAATDITVTGDSPPPPPGTIRGTQGNDSLTGTDGNDSIEGLGGDDTIAGMEGDDTLDGGSGNDSLLGNDGADLLIGGDGNDTLAPGFIEATNGESDPDPDSMRGGLGDDLYVVDNAGDVVSDDGGTDTVAALDMSWTLGADFENLVIANDVSETGYTGIGNELDNHIAATYAGSRLEGRGGNDTLIGGTAETGNHLLGGDGNDSLVGASADSGGDTLEGGAGDDTLDGGLADSEDDTLVGGAGADTFVVDPFPSDFGLDAFSDFTSGTDQLRLDGAHFAAIGPSGNFADADERFHAAAGATGGHDASDRVVYNLTTGEVFYDEDGSGVGAAQLIAIVPELAAADIVVVNGTPADQVIIGTAGPDTLRGGTGNDTLNGLGGDDQLSGSGGNDRIDGGTGNDRMSGDRGVDQLLGGDGNDTLDGLDSDANVDSMDGGTGNDRYVVGFNDMIVADAAGVDTVDVVDRDWTLGAGLENLRLLSTNASGVIRQIGVGNELDNRLESVVEGELYGLGGNDVLSADNGFENILDGGIGNDTLNGAFNANDNFHFTVAPGAGNADLVAGFTSGADEIHLDNAAHAGLGEPGKFSSGDARFWSSSTGAAHDADDRVIYNTSSGRLLYDSDGSGAEEAILIAVLQSAPTLTASDISVIGDPSPGSIEGTDGNDSLMGTDGNDSINGLGGDDTINGAAGNDTVVGNAGNDALFGDASTRFQTNTGSDSLLGGDGNDTLDGGPGAAGDVDTDTLDGGSGDDTYVLWEDFKDILSDPSGVDTVVARGTDWTLGPGFENLVLADGRVFSEAPHGTGNELNNVIRNGSPSTGAWMDGADGNDTLIGGSNFVFSAGSGSYGNDSVVGGTFGTLHIGERSAVVVDLRAGTAIGGGTSGSGNVTFTGIQQVFTASFNDRLVADDSGVRLYGGDGNDTIIGGSGDDELGESVWSIFPDDTGNDQISGGAGNDTIIGWQGDNMLDGGAGDDVFFLNGGAGHYGSDTIVGGDGADKIVLDAPSSAVVVDLAAGRLMGGSPGGGVVFVDIEHFSQVSGNSFDDRIFGNSAANRLTAVGGNDSLVGGAGNDTLVGGDPSGEVLEDDGHDTLEGGLGFDNLTGGSGRDSFVFRAPESAADEVADFVSIHDTLIFDNGGFTEIGPAGNFTPGDQRFFAGNGASSGQDASDRVVYNTSNGELRYDADGSGPGSAQLIATLQGAPTLAASDIVVTGEAGPGPEPIQGTAGNDSLTGTAGDDVLEGLGGNDTLSGLAGDDTLHGGTGNDAFHMGALYGNDVIDGGEGSDKVDFGPDVASDLVVDLAAGTISGGGEGGAGSATLANVERVIAGAFDDLVIGDSAANYIDGRRGNDTISGRAGNDTLLGRDGADRLEGGTGNDTLTGGAGNDSFVFADAPSASNVDRITDFVSADQLLLENAAFTAIGGAGNFGSSDARFWAAPGATSGHDATDRIVYDTSTGSLYYDADGSGSGEAQLVATFQGNPTIAAADVTVI